VIWIQKYTSKNKDARYHATDFWSATTNAQTSAVIVMKRYSMAIAAKNVAK
jgi:hypothetical protein